MNNLQLASVDQQPNTSNYESSNFNTENIFGESDDTDDASVSNRNVEKHDDIKEKRAYRKSMTSEKGPQKIIATNQNTSLLSNEHRDAGVHSGNSIKLASAGKINATNASSHFQTVDSSTKEGNEMFPKPASQNRASTKPDPLKRIRRVAPPRKNTDIETGGAFEEGEEIDNPALDIIIRATFSKKAHPIPPDEQIILDQQLAQDKEERRQRINENQKQNRLNKKKEWTDLVNHRWILPFPTGSDPLYVTAKGVCARVGL